MNLSDVSTNDLLDVYLSYRRKKEEIEKELKGKVQLLNERMVKLENEFARRMKEDELSQLGGSHGIAFQVKKSNATVQDWGALLQYVIDNKAWELLTRRVSKDAVHEFLKEHNGLPPGVKYTVRNIVQVRTKPKQID